MGMRYRARRWAVRLMFGAAPVVAGAAVLIVLVLGFLLGMAFVAQPSRMGFIVRDVMERSSWAEIVAAGGTLLVGYMAWRISRESHMHNVELSKAAKAREEKEDTATLRQMHYVIRRIHAVAESLLPSLEEQKHHRANLIVCFKVSLGGIGKLNFPVAAISLLSRDDVEALHAIQARYSRWIVYSDLLLEILTSKAASEAMSEDDDEELAFLVKKTMDIRDHARAFRLRLEAMLR